MFVRPLALGITAPTAGELLQLARLRGGERLLLCVGAIVSVADKVLGVAVVWWGHQSTALLEVMLVLQGAASGVMTVSERLLVLREVDEVDRGNAQGIISMIDNVSSSVGMALGVALVASPHVSSRTRGGEVAEVIAPMPAAGVIESHHATLPTATLERFRTGMLVVLVMYVAFLWIPAWIFARHRAAEAKKLQAPSSF
jgi:hypothetical protein